MVIVAPERETPGMIASAWLRPMRRASTRVRSPILRFFDPIASAAHKRTPRVASVHGDQDRRSKDRLGLLLQQNSDDRAGHRRDYQQKEQPALDAIAVDERHRHLEPFAPVEDQQRQKGPKMEHDIEGKPGVLLPFEQPGDEYQMSPNWTPVKIPSNPVRSLER